MTEATHTHDTRDPDPDPDRERQRVAVLKERGLSDADAARFGADWPDQPETETYTCHVCRRYLYDDATGLVAPHRLLFVATIVNDGVYTVCGECDPLPLSFWQRLGRWILALRTKPDVNPIERDGGINQAAVDALIGR